MDLTENQYEQLRSATQSTADRLVCSMLRQDSAEGAETEKTVQTKGMATVKGINRYGLTFKPNQRTANTFVYRREQDVSEVEIFRMSLDALLKTVKPMGRNFPTSEVQSTYNESDQRSKNE